jgi:hypothetical protein
MLFNARTLDGIASGHITVAFRRWRQPRVKIGSQTRTAVGVIEVESVHRLEPDEVTTVDSVSAGFASVDELLTWIDKKGNGDLYRIGLRLVGPDPRVALRDAADLSGADVDELTRRLDGMDAAADRPWTRDALEVIRRRPATLAALLAEEVGEERGLFKRRVRRLKELGLTESLPTGYRLSPRGESYLAAN